MINPDLREKKQDSEQGISQKRTFRQRALWVVLISLVVCFAMSLFGLGLSTSINKIDEKLTNYEQRVFAASHSLFVMEEAIGYGGFIHNFKNYILRQDPLLVDHIKKDLHSTYSIIDNFTFDKENPDVANAIRAIRGVVDQYAGKLELLQKLVAEQQSPDVIDRQVRVDDQPAKSAFKFLSQHILNSSRKQVLDTHQSVSNTLKLLGWHNLFLPIILAVGGIIILFMRYNLRLNKALEDTGDYLGELFDMAPDAMLIIDKDGCISDSNTRAADLLGYSREEFRQFKVEKLIPERFRKGHEEKRNNEFKIAQGRMFDEQGEFFVLTKSGNEIPVEIGINYIRRNDKAQAITTLRDISARKEIEMVLQRNENVLTKAQKIAHVGIWEWSILANKLMWSEEMFNIIGLNPKQVEASYEGFINCLHPDDRDFVLNAMNEAVVYGKSYNLEHRVVRPDGEERCVLDRGDVFRNEIGEPEYMVGTVLDVTDQKFAESEFRLADNVFNHTSEAILITDNKNRILRVNHAFTDITGYSYEEVLGKTPKEILNSGRHSKQYYESMWSSINTLGVWEGEIWDRRKDGEIFPCWHNISAIKDNAGKVIQYTSIFSDITDKKVAEEHIRHLAEYDQLTSLPNRVLFNDRLKQAIHRANRSQNHVALMFIDLDRFKSVNDSLGHQAGDQLLREVGRRLTLCVREEDTVARLGGDEFTIILENLKQPEDAALVATKILAALADEIELNNQKVFVGGSIGISTYPDDGSDAETIIKHSDMAMYQAKANGKNQYHFYTNDMAEVVDESFRIENSLRHALENNEFEVYYQPQINGVQNSLVGAEALIRWNDPQKGLVLPAEFIPLAEETGLIGILGKWVIREVCKQAKIWHEAGNLPIRLSVNVSGYQIMQSGFVDSVIKILNETELDPQYLELEITESFVMEHPARGAEAVNKLRQHGVSIAIDDFGTGYSSLSYLKQLPINRLKIDRSFVNDVPGDKDDEAIVAAIISIADSLGLSVIAEGVESQEQVNFLCKKSCTEMQGFFFAKPLKADEFVKVLQAPDYFKNKLGCLLS